MEFILILIIGATVFACGFIIGTGYQEAKQQWESLSQELKRRGSNDLPH